MVLSSRGVSSLGTTADRDPDTGGEMGLATVVSSGVSVCFGVDITVGDGTTTWRGDTGGSGGKAGGTKVGAGASVGAGTETNVVPSSCARSVSKYLANLGGSVPTGVAQ
jgi:hypothetical protein